MSNRCCCVLYSVQGGPFIVNKSPLEGLGSPPPPPPHRELKDSCATERSPSDFVQRLPLCSDSLCLLLLVFNMYLVMLMYCSAIFENQSSTERGTISGAH